MNLDGLQLGHYQLLRPIGSGGMGNVYLAQDRRVRRQVAIKVMHIELTFPNKTENEILQRLFQREMEIVSRLDHPHILTLYDFGEEEINSSLFTYMVMPYRPEGSLNTWLQQQSEAEWPTFEDIADMICQAADALQCAHDSAIVHQDIKPSNFLIRKRKDAPGRPDLFLTDFGIAKIINGATNTQLIRGTPFFMAPEQWEGRPVAASDQYALAVMAYSFLTGQVPFTGNSMQAMYQHMNKQPAPPSSINAELTPEIDGVILKALEKLPEHRFPSIVNFAEALEQTIKENKQPTNKMLLKDVSNAYMEIRKLDIASDTSSPLSPALPEAIPPVVAEELSPEIPRELSPTFSASSTPHEDPIASLSANNDTDELDEKPRNSMYLLINEGGELVDEDIDEIYKYEYFETEKVAPASQESKQSVALAQKQAESSQLPVQEEAMPLPAYTINNNGTLLDQPTGPTNTLENRSLYIILAVIMTIAIILSASIYAIRANLAQQSENNRATGTQLVTPAATSHPKAVKPTATANTQATGCATQPVKTPPILSTALTCTPDSDATINLTQYGTTDWRQWGYYHSTSVEGNWKASNGTTISPYSAYGNTVTWNDTQPNRYTWTDGNSIYPTVTAAIAGISLQGEGSKFTFTIQASGQETVRIYAGVYNGTGTLTATWEKQGSIESAAYSKPVGTDDACFALTYNASPADAILISYQLTSGTQYNSAIYLNAVTVGRN